ncbi:hypothetical protein K437DRAFT_265316 [Tilletiaria anomala UBC 951]|uniref:PHD-type domain-containing protein n=1 Tax=Tilletiaria anomala (strain ATCC 24038 / CBS 436.72 / UBC 951) TaxID=1037660 RepID=A0A066V4L8_TILAU|nr:uncharacterized protein K437DRAFT_265316 [Tilletiaria anomala UBC 951]KDN36356.1 hypothetical protein K437DRAFT_265316 [Tilletiaria anomala UBC 951]
MIRRLLYTLTLDKALSNSASSSSSFDWQYHLRQQYLLRSRPHKLGTHESPRDWATLSLSAKVSALHDLCEWQLQEQPERFRRLLSNDDEAHIWQRVEPIGWDRHGNAYYLFDDNRLWLQHPDTRPLSKRRQKDEPEPEWLEALREEERQQALAKSAKAKAKEGSATPKMSSKRARTEAAAAARARKKERDAQEAAAVANAKKNKGFTKLGKGAAGTASPKVLRRGFGAHGFVSPPLSNAFPPKRLPLRASRRLTSDDHINADGWEVPPREWLADASVAAAAAAASPVEEMSRQGRRLRARKDDGRRKSTRQSRSRTFADDGDEAAEEFYTLMETGHPARAAAKSMCAVKSAGRDAEAVASDDSELSADEGTASDMEEGGGEQDAAVREAAVEARAAAESEAKEDGVEVAGPEANAAEGSSSTDAELPEEAQGKNAAPDTGAAETAPYGDDEAKMDVDREGGANSDSGAASQGIDKGTAAERLDADGDAAMGHAAAVGAAKSEGPDAADLTAEAGQGASAEKEKEDVVEEEEEDDTDWIEFQAVCVTRQEWEEFAVKFAKSRHPDEKALHELLHESVLEKVFSDFDAREKEKALEIALAARKRSSRIAIKESEAAERERDAQARAEMEARMARIREEDDAKATKEREALEAQRSREDRIREREERAAAREREIAERLVRDEEERAARELAREERKRKREAIIANGGVPIDSEDEDGTAGKKQRKKANEPELVQEDWVLECEVCGVSAVSPDEVQPITACEQCGKWQHIACWDKFDKKVPREPRKWDEEDFYCSTCRPPPPEVLTPERQRDAKRARHRENAARRRAAKKQAEAEAAAAGAALGGVAQAGLSNGPAPSTGAGGMSNAAPHGFMHYSPMTSGGSAASPGYNSPMPAHHHLPPNAHPAPSPSPHFVYQRPPQRFPPQHGQQQYMHSQLPMHGYFPAQPRPPHQAYPAGAETHTQPNITPGATAAQRAPRAANSQQTHALNAGQAAPTGSNQPPAAGMLPPPRPPSQPSTPASAHTSPLPTHGSPNGAAPLQQQQYATPSTMRLTGTAASHTVQRVPSASGSSHPGSFPLRYTPKLSPLSQSVDSSSAADVPAAPLDMGSRRAVSPSPQRAFQNHGTPLSGVPAPAAVSTANGDAALPKASALGFTRQAVGNDQAAA